MENKLNGKTVFAVDFDGTLSFGQWPGVGPPNDALINFLKRRKRIGDSLILWTCREGAELKAAIEFCEENGLRFDAINDNLQEIVEKYGVNSRKISCDYYIDDRAISTKEFENWKETV